MNSGRFVLSQVLDLVHRQTLDRLVERYDAESCVRHFGARQQLICMVFAQLTWREGLRDIATCLNAKPEALYHLGFREPVAKSTLADANEQRDWRLWENLAKKLMGQARTLYAGQALGLELENTVYALDSTTIDLSLTLFPWADFRRTKAGIKMHTQLDLRGPIPTCIYITNARQHDVRWLDELVFEPGAFYVMDRGYMDFKRLNLIACAGAFFVTRAKDNLRFSRQRSRPVEAASGIRSDQIGETPLWPKREQPFRHRCGRFIELRCRDGTGLGLSDQPPRNPGADSGTRFTGWQVAHRVVLPLDPKGNLRIKHYFGTSPNAVKTRKIWDSLCHHRLPDGRHPAQTVEPARNIASRTLQLFEHSSF